MTEQTKGLLSVVVPVYNEGAGLAVFHSSLLDVLEATPYKFEVIYCDDGSKDNTTEHVQRMHTDDSRVKLLKLSRNFGKENALTAGITAAKGEAIITLDGDGQHPVELIPQFLEAWKQGAQVVIGVRSSTDEKDAFKRAGSKIFYGLFNKLSQQKLVAGSTDFRLIDSAVRRAFLELKESDRLTRGLIDWLGFTREYIAFKAHARTSGTASYSRRKLIGLAANSFVSLSPLPLYMFGYLGVFITLASLLTGITVVLEQLVLGDPWHWRFTGTAMLSILILFLVGILLMSQGMLSLYISHINNQSRQRPLFIVDYKNSAGVDEPDA